MKSLLAFLLVTSSLIAIKPAMAQGNYEDRYLDRFWNYQHEEYRSRGESQRRRCEENGNVWTGSSCIRREEGRRRQYRDQYPDLREYDE
jgi:hypothetical protein